MADQRDGGIAWTDQTWNPVRGCSRVSAGCTHCYAEQVAARFSGPGQPYEGLAKRVGGEARWTGKVVLVEEHLADPLRWRKPRRVFVNSMSDLFHEALPDEAIDRVFAVMALAPQHTFQVLTKRPERMRAFVSRGPSSRLGSAAWGIYLRHEKHHAIACRLVNNEYRLRCEANPDGVLKCGVSPPEWPLPNVWLGVSVEDQAAADERIPLLLDTPAAVRFLSVEPLIGPVDLTRLHVEGCSECFSRVTRSAFDCTDECGCGIEPIDSACIDWVIVGGESGPGARPCDLAWIRSVVEQCKAAEVPAFVKQLGARPTGEWRPGARRATGGTVEDLLTGTDGNFPFTVDDVHLLSDRKGGAMWEWPEDLRVRELPREPSA